MKTNRKIFRWIGHALGKAWRGWLQLEGWFSSLFKKVGGPVLATKIVLRLLLVAGIVKLMYVSGFLTLLWSLLAVGALIVVLAYMLNNGFPSTGESPSYFPEDEDDPRNKMWYDPVFYNDYGDPNYPPDHE